MGSPNEISCSIPESWLQWRYHPLLTCYPPLLAPSVAVSTDLVVVSLNPGSGGLGVGVMKQFLSPNFLIRVLGRMRLGGHSSDFMTSTLSCHLAHGVSVTHGLLYNALNPNPLNPKP